MRRGVGFYLSMSTDVLTICVQVSSSNENLSVIGCSSSTLMFFSILMFFITSMFFSTSMFFHLIILKCCLAYLLHQDFALNTWCTPLKLIIEIVSVEKVTTIVHNYEERGFISLRNYRKWLH